MFECGLQDVSAGLASREVVSANGRLRAQLIEKVERETGATLLAGSSEIGPHAPRPATPDRHRVSIARVHTVQNFTCTGCVRAPQVSVWVPVAADVDCPECGAKFDVSEVQEYRAGQWQPATRGIFHNRHTDECTGHDGSAPEIVHEIAHQYSDEVWLPAHNCAAA